MQQTRTVELGTGLFALLGMGALFFLTTQTTGGDDFSSDETFEVTARFDNVGSLKHARTGIAMSGRDDRPGDDAFTLMPTRLEAVVTFVVDSASTTRFRTIRMQAS